MNSFTASSADQHSHTFLCMAAQGGDLSVGHGPGATHNEGTAPDRGTPAPDSNLTEIEPTQEPPKHPPTTSKNKSEEEAPAPKRS